MPVLAEILSWVCLLCGGFFVLAGGIGLVRLPEFYTRLHASGLIDTLGLWLILVGLMIQAGPSLVTVKLVLIIAFVFFTSPTSTHAVAQAAFVGGLKPLLAKSDESDSQPEDARTGDGSSRT